MSGEALRQIIFHMRNPGDRVWVDGSDPAVAIARANAAVRARSGEFADQLARTIAELGRVWDNPTAGSIGRGDLDRLHLAAHDLRGLAGTFDYPLITRIGHSLCDFLESLEATGDRELQILQAHVDAIRVVFRDQILGEGGAAGRELMRALAAAIARLRS